MQATLKSNQVTSIARPKDVLRSNWSIEVKSFSNLSLGWIIRLAIRFLLMMACLQSRLQPFIICVTVITDAVVVGTSSFRSCTAACTFHVWLSTAKHYRFDDYYCLWPILRAWWPSRFGALRLQGRRFESHSNRHVGTLDKSFTRSCLYNVMWRPVWLPCG